jgi:glycerol-3-phosphate dehydrogenase
LGQTLVGTTESRFDDSPDHLNVSEKETSYLLDRFNRYFVDKVRLEDVQAQFAGLRWLAVEERATLSATSRELVIGRIDGPRGMLLTLYGGKLTGYRSVAERLGDRITRHFGEFKKSTTSELKSWKISRSYTPPSTRQRWEV